MVEKDGVKTAICPVCGIDTLLGDACVEISADLERWPQLFKQTLSIYK